MAPNRKHSTLVLETVPSFNLQVQAKYAPLTSEVSQEEKKAEPLQKKQFGIATTIYASHTKEPSNANNSYWDWPADDEIVDESQSEKTRMIENILKEEQARELLSADHIVANLEKSSDAKKETIYASQIDEDYWYDGNDHATDDVPVATQPQQQSYWDWPTRTPQEEKQKLIDDIMEEERCRKVLSMLHVVDNIVRQSASTSNKILSEKPYQVSESYWEWTHEPSPSEGYWEFPATEQDEKKLIIQQIMKEEQVRKQFSIQHLESKLLQQASDKGVTPAVTANTAPGSSYWDWDMQ